MIREICKEDHDAFIKMEDEFYSSKAVLHNIPAEYKERTFKEIMSGSPFAKAYIIEKDKEIAGYVLVAITYSNEAGGRVVWIDEIYVSEQFRGHGLGREALSFVQEKYKDAARIRLEAEEDNKGAIKLYKSEGFEELPYLQMIKDMRTVS